MSKPKSKSTQSPLSPRPQGYGVCSEIVGGGRGAGGEEGGSGHVQATLTPDTSPSAEEVVASCPSLQAEGEGSRTARMTPLQTERLWNGSELSICTETLGTIGAALAVIIFGLLLLAVDPNWFWQDDFQSFQLACFRDVARSWQQGEFPLLSPYSWQAGALAAEYQNGAFSVFLSACVVLVFSIDLSLAQAAAALSIIHLAVLAAGTFRLGRRLGLPANLALLAALISTLSGWNMIWGAKAWFPALASFAWLPWLWWGLERALDQRTGICRFVPAGLFAYLVVTAGWPFTVLMGIVVSVWLLARTRWQSGGWRDAWPVVAAWIVGLGLSAPAWLMLLEYTQHTFRGRSPTFQLNWDWRVPFGSLPGFAFPAYYAVWSVFGADKPHRCVELVGGLVPVAVLIAALCRHGTQPLRRHGWLLALTGMALVLTMAPSTGNFRWSFRWLPLFFLALGLLTGLLLRDQAHAQVADPQRGQANVGLWALILAALGWLLTTRQALDPTATTMWQGAVLTALCLFWMLAVRFLAARSLVRQSLPAIVVLGSAWWAYAPVHPFLEVPDWPLEDTLHEAALPADVRYLSFYTREDIFEADLRRAVRPFNGQGSSLFPGNMGMYGGQEFVNGYSPMLPLETTSLFGIGFHGILMDIPEEGGSSLKRLLEQDTRPHGLLDLMGIDGIILAERFADHAADLEANGWLRVASIPDGSVWRRIGAMGTAVRFRTCTEAVVVDKADEALTLLRIRRADADPRVLLSHEAAQPGKARKFATPVVQLESEKRCSVSMSVANPDAQDSALVVFQRPWFAGYRAYFNGQELPVDRLALVLPAVQFPPGASGKLLLEYRPASLVVGCWVAGTTAAVLIPLFVIVLWVHGRKAVDKRIGAAVVACVPTHAAVGDLSRAIVG